MVISEAITIAYQYYQTGYLAQAESIGVSILQQQPNSVEALQLLSAIAHQVGRLPEAINYYQQIVALKPDQAEIYYSLGAALHQQGQLAAAIAHYQQAIALKPGYADAHYDLGHAFKEQGDPSAAIAHYQQAVAFNPNDVEARCNLANTLLEQGQSEAAIAHYQQVIAVKPDVPGVYYNLGNALRQQNQLEAAITHYRWALAIDPNYLDVYFQIGGALDQQDQLEDAIYYYEQAISVKPSPDAYTKLGNTLLKRGRHSEAITVYKQALALESDDLETYLGLGCALIEHFQLEEATACFQQALTFYPKRPEIYHNLGIAFAGQNLVDEAIHYFQTALQLKPDMVEPYWQNQLMLPVLYNTQQQIPVWRHRFCRGLNDLIQKTDLNNLETRKQALTRLGKIAFTFYLNYQGFNDRGLQRKYGKFVHRVMAANYPQWASLSRLPLSHKRKIRVGYLSSLFRGHTVGLLTVGWFKNCDRQRFEVYTYHIGSQTDAMTQDFRAYSDRFHHLYGGIEAVCQQVIADELDILVFTDIGMEPRVTEIAGLRLAPVQCMFWGHPVTSGLPTIDYFLSSDLMEPENAQIHYSEKLVRLPNISICYEKPSLPPLTKTRADFQLRENAVVYLSCQSSFKYLPQFDDIYAQIAQRVPQAQFAFICSHAIAITEQFQARLQRAFARFGLNSKDYCVFLPKQVRVDYLNLNLVSNIFLDTFSWSGGNTTLEAIACGLPVVTCPGEFMRGRHSYAILKMMGVTDTIAQTKAEYVEIAVRLGLDPEWRQDIVRQIYARHSWLYNDKTCVTALESFYKQAVCSL